MIRVLGIAPCDWANHAHRVKEMMHQPPECEYRLVTLMRHPNPGYQYDIVGMQNKASIVQLIQRADVVHIFLSSSGMTIESLANLMGINKSLLLRKRIVATAFSSFWHKTGMDTWNEWKKYTKQMITATPALRLYGTMHYLPQPFDTKLVEQYRRDRSQDELSILHCPWEGKATKGTKYFEDVFHVIPGFDCFVKLRLPYKQYLHEKAKYKFYADQIKFGGYGYNAIESMAMGQPCFAFFSSYAKRNMTLFSKGAIKLLQTGPDGQLMMDQFLALSSDPDLYLSYSQECIDWAEKNHSYSSLYPHYLEMYQGV